MRHPSNDNNNTTFCSPQVRQFLCEWGVSEYSCDVRMFYQVTIAERSHRSIKRIAARKQCTILEAMYWYNVTPKEDVSPVTVPAIAINTYWIRAKGIDVVLSPDNKVVFRPYAVRDLVWMKPPSSQCTTRFKQGIVTGVISQQSCPG